MGHTLYQVSYPGAPFEHIVYRFGPLLKKERTESRLKLLYLLIVSMGNKSQNRTEHLRKKSCHNLHDWVVGIQYHCTNCDVLRICAYLNRYEGVANFRLFYITQQLMIIVIINSSHDYYLH